MDDKERIAELEKQLEAEKKGREDDKKAHEAEIARKDAVIERKTKDIVGARKNAQKIKELSDEEKEKMSEREIENHNALLAEQERREELEKSIAERDKKERDARRDAAIKKIAGEDTELADKIKGNYDRIKDSEGAQTEEEISKVVVEAHNMLGTPSGDPVGGAAGGIGGGAAPGEEEKGDGYAGTQEGKGLADAMGLQQSKEEEK
jgi:hypothetical protein